MNDVGRTRAEIEATVRQILTELFPDGDVSTLTGSDDLKEALDLDSMAVIDVALEVERRLEIHIPDEDLDRLTSIDAAVDYLTSQPPSR
jgi:acyl carrier protein